MSSKVGIAIFQLIDFFHDVGCLPLNFYLIKGTLQNLERNLVQQHGIGWTRTYS